MASDLALREAEQTIEILEDELSRTKRQKSSLAQQLSPLGPIAEIAGANAVAFGASYADARFSAPGQNNDRGLIQGGIAGIAGAIGVLGRKNPLVREAAKTVAIGASCALSAKAGRAQGLRDRLKAEAAKAAESAVDAKLDQAEAGKP
jgi:hypothetical protein